MQAKDKGIVVGIAQAKVEIFKSCLVLHHSPSVLGHATRDNDDVRAGAVQQQGSKFRRNGQRHRAGFLFRVQAGQPCNRRENLESDQLPSHGLTKKKT
jgi:hypothetical protein